MLQLAVPALAVLAAAAALSFTPPCTIQTIAGPANFFTGDGGPAANAYFHDIGGFRFDQAGNLYIADTENNRVRKVDTAGIVTTIAGNGIAGFSGDGGPATAAELSNPVTVSPDNQGNVYILDGDNRVRKVDTSGIIATIAGNGTPNFAGDGGPGPAAELQDPSDLIADGNGNVFIADSNNFRVREVNAQGIISTIAGTGGSGVPLPTQVGGPAAAYDLGYPVSLTVDSSGNLYIGARPLNGVFKVDGNGIISLYAGGGTGTSPVGQPVTSVYLDPLSMAFDSSGNLVIDSPGENNGGIYEVSPAGVISEVSPDEVFLIAVNQTTVYYAYGGAIIQVGSAVPYAGAYEDGTSGDGGPATSALFLNPGPIAVDSQGNVYIVDSYAYQVRKVAPSGIITHIAGTPTGETASGDGGPATQASIAYTQAIATDTSGNVYMADYSGNIRKINTEGIISSLVSNQYGLNAPLQMAIAPSGVIYVQPIDGGLLAFNPDGTETGASVGVPCCQNWALDPSGNFHSIADGDLYKQATSGAITKTPLPQFTQFQQGLILAVDGSGNAYIASQNYGSQVIQEVTSSGQIFTIARQNSLWPYANGSAGQVDLGYVTALVSDAVGDLYFAESYDFNVRELTTGCPAVVQPLIAANAVVNAGSYDSQYLAAGEISAMFGYNLGPAAGTSVPVESGAFPSQYAGVSVLVDGYLAPLLYVSQNQVNFVVPFEVEGQQSRAVQISYNGIPSDEGYAAVGESDLGVFAIANPNYSINSAASPVSAGSYVIIYGTGQGVSATPQTDGEIMSSLVTPVLPITAQIDGQPAQVLYAGSAPGLVAGVLQINLAIPAQLSPGQHTLWITAGTVNADQNLALFTQ